MIYKLQRVPEVGRTVTHFPQFLGCVFDSLLLHLLVHLLLTHPYIIYGGELDREVWQKEYDDANNKLKAMEGNIGKAVEAEDEETQEEETKGSQKQKTGKPKKNK